MLHLTHPRLAARLLAVSAALLFTSACGNGATYGMAPGYVEPEPEPERDAGPPLPEIDAGPQDAGPQPDAGDGCTTETREVTEEEDFEAFQQHDFAAAFGCASCHNGGSPEARKQPWGTSDTSEEGWHYAVTTLLGQSDQVGAPPEETTLYKSFNQQTATLASIHGVNEEMKAAVVAWVTWRRTPIVETVCLDAGPVVDEPDCTPSLPSEAESAARFTQLGIGDGIAAHNCQLCHVGAKSATGTDQAWGATTDDDEGWHVAFWGKAQAEPVTDVTTSTLYTHLDNINGTHGAKPAERDATGEWLDYIYNGELPPGCD